MEYMDFGWLSHMPGKGFGISLEAGTAFVGRMPPPAPSIPITA